MQIECQPSPKNDKLIEKPVGPFLKWAGGKRWLVRRIRSMLPYGIDRLIEPFLGSAAVYFSLLPKSALLGDTNPNLINVYTAIKTDALAVWDYLTIHAIEHSYDYYYNVRSRGSNDAFESAADFIYLNRTCWNGLYRVNKSGQFNVPRGTKNVVLFDGERPELIAEALRPATLLCADFECLISQARPGELIYADPPYTVKHNSNGFTKYNETLFSWSDQERLAKCLLKAKSRGVKVIASNADHKSIRDLYRHNFGIRKLHRSSVLAGDANYRTSTSELLITG